MTSSLVSNPVVNPDRSSTRRKKRKKIQSQIFGDNLRNSHLKSSSENSTIQWKSEAQQQIYSSKLLQALRQVRRSSLTTPTSASKCGRAVREAADRVLAATARGRSRWSRAILTSRLKLKFLKKNNINKRHRNVMVITTGSSLSQKKSRLGVLRLKMKSLPAVQRKTRVLGRLVPGCRKQTLPVILEEATDYIAALQMQVQAMSALAELLSLPGSSSAPPAIPPGYQLNQLTSSRQSPPSV